VQTPELKADAKGRKEFEDYQAKLELQKADLRARIDKNRAWIVSGGRPQAEALARCLAAGARPPLDTRRLGGRGKAVRAWWQLGARKVVQWSKHGTRSLAPRLSVLIPAPHVRPPRSPAAARPGPGQL
jgi:hypothetical protein